MSKTKKDIENLFELSPEALFLEDSEGKVLDVNQKAREMLGYEKEELLGQDVNQIVPEDAPVYLPDEIDEATRAGEPIETVNLSKDGTEVPVELRSRMIEVEGEERMLISIRDIAERKQAEKELKRKEWAVESALSGVAIANLEGKLEYVNPSFLRIWGYEKKEEVLGRSVTEFWKGKERVEEKVLPSLRDEGEWSGELVGEKKDGSSFYAQALASLITDDKDRPTALMSSFVDIADRKQAEQALTEEKEKLRSLHEVVDELQHQNTEEEILQTAVEVAENILDFKFCDISLVEGDYLVPKARASGLDPEESVPFEIGEGITGKTMQKGETIWGDDVSNHPEVKPTNQDFRAYISVPIGNLGVFQVISEERGSFTEQDVELAEILAGHLREEVNRVRLEGELRDQAIKDPLTNLYNRRYFNEALRKEVERCKRYDNSLAFLIMDIDRFKEVNDKYSHLRGDKVLKEVANLFKKNVRDADTVVRYGGDEFLVMMPETNGEAENTSIRLKEELSEWNEESTLLDFPLTLAMGISHWIPDQGRDVEEALKEADKKMYDDKGR